MIDYKFQLSGLERGRILVNAARIIRENVEELSQNEVLDNGKPIWEARYSKLPNKRDVPNNVMVLNKVSHHHIF